tara:strand:- start:7 stop:747 length:741 start_codon:yes stop_codon:yes gene_type:complete
MNKLSIIMVCKNSSRTIEDSIKSFIDQDFLNKELIIIDGGSTDGTNDIIFKYKEKNIIFEQIENLGLYASINHGIKKSSGNIIGLLHSDDIYYSKNVLSKIHNEFSSNYTDIIYTDIVFFNKKNKIVRKWVNSNITDISDTNISLPPHTGIYIKKKVFDLVGYYNENYKISSDIELMYKIFTEEKLKKKYLNIFSLKMRIGGLSTKSPLSIIRSNYETYKIFNNLNLKFPILMITKKIIKKIMQYF